MKNIFVLMISCLLVLSSCDNNNNGGTPKKYDPSEMLKDMGEKIITPSYKTLSLSTKDLKEKVEALKSNPTQANLSAAQNSLKESYKAWQKCSFFDFGPALDNGLSLANNYPINQSLIQSNISNGNYNLESGANIATIGFPALDYLLFQDASNLLTHFADAKYSKYAVDVATQLASKSKTVYDAWKNNYQNTFVNNKDLGVGGSLGLLSNSMIKEYEKGGREGKIGIPAGIRTLNQVQLEKVEAYYSQQSIVLAKAHIAAFKTILNGTNNNGFMSLLEASKNQELASNINTHLNEVESSLNTLTDPFSDMLQADNTKAKSTYGKYQKLLPLLKVEMMAKLGLLINYADTDGD